MCNSLGKGRREVGSRGGKDECVQEKGERETGKQKDQQLRGSNTAWESQGNLHKGCNGKAGSCKTNRSLWEKKCR